MAATRVPEGRVVLAPAAHMVPAAAGRVRSDTVSILGTNSELPGRRNAVRGGLGGSGGGAGSGDSTNAGGGGGGGSTVAARSPSMHASSTVVPIRRPRSSRPRAWPAERGREPGVSGTAAGGGGGASGGGGWVQITYGYLLGSSITGAIDVSSGPGGNGGNGASTGPGGNGGGSGASGAVVLVNATSGAVGVTAITGGNGGGSASGSTGGTARPASRSKSPFDAKNDSIDPKGLIARGHPVQRLLQHPDARQRRGIRSHGVLVLVLVPGQRDRDAPVRLAPFHQGRRPSCRHDRPSGCRRGYQAILHEFRQHERLYSAAIVPNQPYLCVATYDGVLNVQKFYVNSNIAAGTGALSGATITNAQALNLGTDAAVPSGMLVTISQPAAYRAVLSSADVLALLQGTYTPLSSGLTGGGATHFWSLSGSNGRAPQAGDAGLANSGSAGAGTGSKYVFSSLNPTHAAGSAIYVPDLTYSPATTINPYVGYCGQTVFFLMTATAGGALAGASQALSNPTIRVNGSPVSPTGPVYADAQANSPTFCYLLPSVVRPTDVVDYTVPLGGLVSTAGACGPVSSPVVMPNYTGRLEPVFGGVTPFAPSPKMPLGINIGGVPFLNYFQYNVAANARLRFVTPFNSYTAGGVCTVDSNFQPLTLTTNYTFYSQLANASQSNGVDATGYPVPAGVYSVVFEDVNAANPSKALKVWMVANNAVCTGGDRKTAARAWRAAARSIGRLSVRRSPSAIYSITLLRRPPDTTSGWAYIPDADGQLGRQRWRHRHADDHEFLGLHAR